MKTLLLMLSFFTVTLITPSSAFASNALDSFTKSETPAWQKTLSLNSCTSSGQCCAHWTADGQCAHEYPCTECSDPGVNDNDGCHDSGMCCIHRAADGECIHEVPCGRC